MHIHPSAGVFNPVKFALSHEEEEEEDGIFENALQMKCSGCFHYCYNSLTPYPES